MPCQVIESWIALQWWGWEPLNQALRGPAGTAFYNPFDDQARNRWRRRVKYHLHITGSRANGAQIADRGLRMVHEIIDLPVGLEPATMAIPPQFTVVCDSCAPIQEDAENRYYSLPRVQRVVTTLQNTSEPSDGLPTSGAFGGLGVAGWRAALPLGGAAVWDIVKEDRVHILGGPRSSDDAA